MIRFRLSRRRFAVPSAALVLTVLSATGGNAQVSFELDTLGVEVASRASPATVATRAVEILDAERLRALPVRSVSEALRWAAGVDLQARSPAQADLSIRGASYEQVLVLVDGIPMGDAQTGHFDLDLTVPLDQVERIEVLRGPASALYGADAVGGVVNVVTRGPGGPATGRVEGGSWDRSLVSGRAGVGDEGRGVSAGVERASSDGHREGTDYRVLLGHARGVLALGGGRLSLTAGHARRDFGADAFYAPFASYEETRTTLAALGWARRSGAWRVEPRVSVRRHDDDFVLQRADPSFYRNVHRSLRTGGELVAGWRPEGGAVSLVLGGEAYRDDLESTSLGDRVEDRQGVFGEAVWTGAGALVAAGLRLDHHERFGTALSPNLSASRLVGTDVRVRGAVGRSFRPPTFTERYYEDPGNVGNPDLDPERSWTVEVGADVALPAGGLLRATVFRRWGIDLIDWARPAGSDETVPYQTRNVESATFDGVELALSGLAAGGVRLEAAGSLLAVDATEHEGYFSKYALRPLVRQATLGASRALPGGVRLGVHGLHRLREGAEGSHTLLEVRGSVELPVGRLYVDLTNVTDAAWEDVTGKPAPGRALGVGWSVGGS